MQVKDIKLNGKNGNYEKIKIGNNFLQNFRKKNVNS